MRWISFLMLTFFLAGCQSDAMTRKQLIGQWDVSFRAETSNESPDNKPAENTTPEAEDGDTTNDLGEGLEKLGEGLQKMAEGLTTMAEGLRDAITKQITFNIELREDSTIKVGDSSDFELNLAGNDTRWDVEAGQFMLYSPKDTLSFDITKTNEGFELKGEKGIIVLSKPESAK